ncbi:T9SS type A sorting domain-containing protein [Hymenobacter sp. AT01-02]|uniref:T9SS type A sorting domain-containing protein n=1 Tax=Hymenobacter sp. AT01-02 TaxID=1571877 RepID=UPI0006983FCC|nr:T9SS type A sorting domain-containing protein [Hymenobacter sp. AT01-02]
MTSTVVSSFTEHVVDLSGYSALNNKSNIILRLLASGASGTSTLRIDNVQIQAVSSLNPVPVLTSINPTSIVEGSNGFALTVTGSGFFGGSTVQLDGVSLATTVVSATQLTASVPASSVSKAGTATITVVNPGPGGGTSGSSSFVISPVVRWDGGAGSSSWFDAQNWVGDAVPTENDDVLLDHAVVAGRYTVLLVPRGATSTTSSPAVGVRSLTLNPGAGDSILFEIPTLNTNSAPLSLTRSSVTEIALAVHSKAVVTNASDVGVIDVVGANPTFYLYNGGTYRHYTDRPHAALVENLAAVVGTEAGIWEFRAKSQSSATVSINGRTYPNLLFRSRLGQNAINYTGSGSSPLVVRGKLVVGPGATFTASTNSEIRVAGDIVVQGAFRFQPQTSGTTTARLVLNGSTAQRISGAAWGGPASSGSYLGADVPLQITNTSAAGVTLATSVQVNNVLQLTAGRLTTDATNMLTLLNDATGGSDNSFVNGPVARVATGPATLAFPLGRPTSQGTAYRPLVLTITALTQATAFTAVQTEGSFEPGLLTGDLRRVNRVRHFAISAEPSLAPGAFAGTVALVFGPDDQVNNPEASALVVARNNGSGWSSVGRGGSTGTATAGSYVSGSLTSGPMTGLGRFALASTDASISQNPLPVSLTKFDAQRLASGVQVHWTTATEQANAQFEVQRRTANGQFTTVATLAGQGNSAVAHNYTWMDETREGGTLYYRLRQVDVTGTATFSAVAVVSGATDLAIVYPNPVQDQLTIQVPAALRYQVLNLLGQVVLTGKTQPGTTYLRVEHLLPGTYYLQFEGEAKTRGVTFHKQ